MCILAFIVYMGGRIRFKVMMLVMVGEPGRGSACAFETFTAMCEVSMIVLETRSCRRVVIVSKIVLNPSLEV